MANIKRLGSLGQSPRKTKILQKRKSAGPGFGRRNTMIFSIDPNSNHELLPVEGAPPTFGTSLQDLLDYERKIEAQICMPSIIEKCLSYLLTYGLSSEGIFRVPGNTVVVESFKKFFNTGRYDSIDFFSGKPQSVSVPEVSSLLKSYLRDNPEPLFSKSLEGSFVDLLDEPDNSVRVSKYRSLSEKLPEVNQIVIKELLFLLFQVHLNAFINKMTSTNLSVVFGSMGGIFATKPRTSDLVGWLIDSYKEIYELGDLHSGTPIILRKFTGHMKGITALFEAGGYIWSFDTSGVACIWDDSSLSFKKTFDTDLGKLFSPPVIFKDNLWCASLKCLKYFPLALILDTASTQEQILNAGKLFEGLDLKLITYIEIVDDELWVTGDKTVIISKEMSVKELNTSIDLIAECNNVAQKIHTVNDKVWILREKIIEVWDKSSHTLVKEINRCDLVKEGSKITNFINVHSSLWILGQVRTFAAAWIIDPESKTLIKKLGHDIALARGSFYQAVPLDNYMMIGTGDSKILVYNLESLHCIGKLDNHHIGSIKSIVIRKLEEPEGWIMWTGSTDKTIEVRFFPVEYINEFRKAQPIIPSDIELVLDLPSPKGSNDSPRNIKTSKRKDFKLLSPRSSEYATIKTKSDSSSPVEGGNKPITERSITPSKYRPAITPSFSVEHFNFLKKKK